MSEKKYDRSYITKLLCFVKFFEWTCFPECGRPDRVWSSNATKQCIRVLLHFIDILANDIIKTVNDITKNPIVPMADNRTSNEI